MSGAETILGEIPVSTKLNVGSERLSLFFTSNRIIVARIGKRGTGSMTALPLFSILTGGLEGLLRSRKDKARKKAAETSLTPADILAADKENFPLGYDEIVSVEILQSSEPSGRTSFTMVTRDDKLSFTTGFRFEKLIELFQDRLGPRVSVRRK